MSTLVSSFSQARDWREEFVRPLNGMVVAKAAAQTPTTSATTGAPTIPQDKPQSRCRAHGTKALEWPQRRHHFSGLVLQEEISD